MRGKQASSAANRRYEASISHIDRLTSELVEAKVRARQYEKAAVELPGVHQELERLRQQLIDGTSDLVEKERTLHRKQIVEITNDYQELRELFERISRRMPKDVEVFTEDDLDMLTRHRLGEELHMSLQHNRENRRAGKNGRRNSTVIMQDNLRTVGENFNGKKIPE